MMEDTIWAVVLIVTYASAFFIWFIEYGCKKYTTFKQVTKLIKSKNTEIVNLRNTIKIKDERIGIIKSIANDKNSEKNKYYLELKEQKQKCDEALALVKQLQRQVAENESDRKFKLQNKYEGRT